MNPPERIWAIADKDGIVRVASGTRSRAERSCEPEWGASVHEYQLVASSDKPSTPPGGTHGDRG